MINELIQRVQGEESRQAEKWGANRDQHPTIWLTILSEEVGEVAKEVCDGNCNVEEMDLEKYKTEIVQCIAVLSNMYANVETYEAARDKYDAPAELSQKISVKISEEHFHARMSAGERRKVFFEQVDAEALKWCAANNKVLIGRTVARSGFSRAEHVHDVELEIKYYNK